MSPQNPTSDADIEAAIQAELPWLLERAKARDAAASEDTVSGKATAMTPFQPSDFLDLIPAMLQAPHRSMHCTYDEPADVMYVNFEPGAEATDSELEPDDINTLDRDRTCNLQLRRLTLYPIELRGRTAEV